MREASAARGGDAGGARGVRAAEPRAFTLTTPVVTLLLELDALALILTVWIVTLRSMTRAWNDPGLSLLGGVVLSALMLAQAAAGTLLVERLVRALERRWVAPPSGDVAREVALALGFSLTALPWALGLGTALEHEADGAWPLPLLTSLGFAATLAIQAAAAFALSVARLGRRS